MVLEPATDWNIRSCPGLMPLIGSVAQAANCGVIVIVCPSAESVGAGFSRPAGNVPTGPSGLAFNTRSSGAEPAW
jgi:hypothetical protein